LFGGSINPDVVMPWSLSCFGLPCPGRPPRQCFPSFRAQSLAHLLSSLVISLSPSLWSVSDSLGSPVVR
jgi:hypothetical protein